MTPAIFTRGELRAWLRSLGLERIRLPRSLDKVLYVDQPGGGCWIVRALITGAYSVAPYREPDDVLIARRLRAGAESARRLATGEAPYTLLEAAHALGLDSPVSEADLIVLGHVCDVWGVRTNIDDDPCFKRYRR